MIVSANELRAVMPRSGEHIAQFLEPLNTALEEFAIDNPDRIAAFLAQIAVESAELSKVEEGLAYSVARLLVVWPTRFKTPADALPYAYKPEKLANHVYADRLGNGNEASGDGWRHRGAGLIQITGRDAQLGCARYFKVPSDHVGDWLRTPEGACRSAGWFWYARALSPLADMGQFALITRRVSGSIASLDERSAYWGRAKAVFN